MREIKRGSKEAEVGLGAEEGFGGGRNVAQKGDVGRGDHEHRREGVGGTIDSALLRESE